LPFVAAAPGADCAGAACTRIMGLSGCAGGLGVSAALLESDAGSDGVSSAAAPAPATPAATTPAFDGDDAGAAPAGAAGGGATVCACPLGLVMVTTFVVLLTTTVLWMLL
jgi:hypothetical protein